MARYVILLQNGKWLTRDGDQVPNQALADTWTTYAVAFNFAQRFRDQGARVVSLI